MLWIAFRLYLWGIGDTLSPGLSAFLPVVNCFQIVSLRYWWHQKIELQMIDEGCELLSDCIFEVLVTPNNYVEKFDIVLWIAFRLYLWGIGDTYFQILRLNKMVVNCFQIVSLRYWWHRMPTLEYRTIVVNCFQIVSLRYWWHRG